MSIPPRDAFAAAARKAMEDHTEWDSPHAFSTLHWDGGKLTVGTYACIMPDIHPDQYPALMIRVAREQIEKFPAEPAYGYLLQAEGFGVIEPAADASEEERERFRAARVGRTFHQRPDAIESAFAYAADIHGRVWAAVKRRGEPGITETFYPPGRTPGGQFIKALLVVAYGTGMLAHGLPEPQRAWN